MAIKICIYEELRRGSGLRKFNNSLLQDENFPKELKKYVKEFQDRKCSRLTNEVAFANFV